MAFMFIPYKLRKSRFHTTIVANYNPWSFQLVCYLCSYIWSWPFWVCKLFTCKFPLTFFCMCYKCLQWLLEVTMNFNPFINLFFGINPLLIIWFVQKPTCVEFLFILDLLISCDFQINDISFTQAPCPCLI